MVRRLLSPYLLVVAVAAAAAALGYYGFRQSQDIKIAQRRIALETMRELAEEKVLNIQYGIARTDRSIIAAVDPKKLSAVRERVRSEQAAIVSILVLDDALTIVPGGYFSKRRNPELFRESIFPFVLQELNLKQSSTQTPRYRHLALGDVALLFSFAHKTIDGKRYYVVIEQDVSHLIGFVFPKFFDIRSRHIYQIVDENNAVVYGPQVGISSRDTAEVPFSQTLTRWRVRVTHRERPASGRETLAFDLLAIGGALLIIASALYALLVTVRRERRANELKSEFISNVSHELRTPLSIVRMYGELLSSDRVTEHEKVREYGEVIGRESERLTQLIDNVLDFAKIEKGADTYSMKLLSIADVIERVLAIATPQLTRDNLKVDVDIEPDLWVDGDESSLTLAFLNVVDNAIKYASAGEKLDISARGQDKRITLTFRDYGPGFAEGDRSLVFTRFYRGNQAPGVRGSGIGLALVRRVTKAHGGAVVAKNAEPGAQIEIRLPRCPKDSPRESN